jgi:O-antigen/teichoic acid export membrane protein
VATDGDLYGHIPAYALVLGFAAVPFLVWEQYGSQLLTATGQLSIYNRAQVYGRTVGLVLVVFLVALLDTGVAGALIALLVSQLIVAGAGARHLVHLAGPALALDRATFKDLISGGVQLHMTAIGTFLYTSAAVLIVQTLEGPTDTGLFALAVSLTGMALLVPRGASMVLYAEVARDGPDATWPANRKVLLTLSGVMAIAALVGVLVAPTVIPLVFGEDFEGSVSVFQILVCALVGQTFSLIMAPQWIGRGYFWQASVVNVVLGICNVAACFLLVDAYGMVGAAWALFGVYFISVFGNGALAVWIDRRVERQAEAETGG